MAKKKPSVQPSPYPEEDSLTRLMRHYMWGVQDMDTRRVRKNGWNEVINSYMGKIPVNWPYNSVVTNPMIRTTILEKTGRLLNAKLQGRLIPREGGDLMKAKINNALLDFQWDNANSGGSMIEKIAMVDQYARIFGAGFTLNYWNVVKNTNDIKVIDPRDIMFDGAATHVRNCRWIQVREFTTFDKLEERGYDVSDARSMAEKGEITSEMRSTRYTSIVKANRGLVDRTGMIDDLKNPVTEIVTEWGIDRNQVPYCTIFMPKYALVLSEKKGDEYPYKHSMIPISMLRYYPLVDDIYGESEVEGVLGLQRGINAMICGFLDECNIKIRPPLKISAQGVRIETIEYGPGARWIMNNPNMVEEMRSDGGFIQAFNSVYPMMVTAFQTAMGEQSQYNQLAQNVSERPTARQVMSDEKQQNVRDQYNQLYLTEYIKDLMLMWFANNKQFLFDDPTKRMHILKIIGKDAIQQLQQMELDKTEIPPYAMREIANTVGQYPSAVNNNMLEGIMKDVSMPVNPVVENPTAPPDQYVVHNKLEVEDSGQEAQLYITPDDFDGNYDYVPDVKSMAAGTGIQLQQARQKALEYALNPDVIGMLTQQGESLKIKELLVSNLEDAGYKDAESLFQPVQPNQPGITQPGATPLGSMPAQGMANPQGLPSQPVPGGIPQTNGLQQQGQTPGSVNSGLHF